MVMNEEGGGGGGEGAQGQKPAPRPFDAPRRGMELTAKSMQAQAPRGRG